MDVIAFARRLPRGVYLLPENARVWLVAAEISPNYLKATAAGNEA